MEGVAAEVVPEPKVLQKAISGHSHRMVRRRDGPLSMVMMVVVRTLIAEQTADKTAIEVISIHRPVALITAREGRQRHIHRVFCMEGVSEDIK